MSDFPPYTCTGEEQVYDDIEIFDADGNYVNGIIASECFANWYCEVYGYTWRHRPPDPIPVDHETPVV
jgi:hypothetical protein